jgi:hypothetical protein
MPNISAHAIIKCAQMDIKIQKSPITVVVLEFNITLTPIDRSSKQKMNKEILNLNDTIDLKDLTDIYRVFHPAIA